MYSIQSKAHKDHLIGEPRLPSGPSSEQVQTARTSRRIEHYDAGISARDLPLFGADHTLTLCFELSPDSKVFHFHQTSTGWREQRAGHPSVIRLMLEPEEVPPALRRTGRCPS